MMYYIIVFENLRFRKSTRKRVARILKNLHSEERCYKDAFSVTVFTEYVWTVGQTGEKKISVLKQKRILVEGA